MTGTSRGIRNVRLGQLWEVAGLHDVDIIGGGLQHFAQPRTWKGEVELNRRGMGRGAADSCVRCGSNVELEDSGGCCGSMLTKRSVIHWRVARHGYL